MGDEIRLSWEKKVSLREIAQFYEDKLRELDARMQRLTNNVRELTQENSQLVDKIKKEVEERNKVELAVHSELMNLISSSVEHHVLHEGMKIFEEQLMKQSGIIRDYVLKLIPDIYKHDKVNELIQKNSEFDDLIKKEADSSFTRYKGTLVIELLSEYLLAGIMFHLETVAPDTYKMIASRTFFKRYLDEYKTDVGENIITKSLIDRAIVKHTSFFSPYQKEVFQ